MTKIVSCKCGGRICENDSHYICEHYLEELKRGIKQQQQIIDALQNYDDEDEI